MATHSSVLAWRIPGTGEPGEIVTLVAGEANRPGEIVTLVAGEANRLTEAGHFPEFHAQEAVEPGCTYRPEAGALAECKG